MRTGYIYKITNPTGKVYIGQTDNIERRKSQYRRLRTKKQAVLHCSLLSHGWDKHIFEIIETITTDEDLTLILDEKEIYYIALYRCNKYRYQEDGGMNLTDGGTGVKRGRKLTEKERLVNAKAVDCYNIDGTFYMTFSCMKDGEKHFSPNNKGKWSATISTAIKNKVIAYKKVWKFTEQDISFIDEVINNVKNKKENRTVHPNHKRAIVSFNPDGSLFMEFESGADAARYFGGDIDVNKTGICNAIKKRHRFKNKYWIYKKEIRNLEEIKKSWNMWFHEYSKEEQRILYNKRKVREYHNKKLQLM